MRILVNKAMAYFKAGMNPDGTPLLTEEEKAMERLRAAGPSAQIAIEQAAEASAPFCTAARGPCSTNGGPP